jgi:hypothetical protein
VIVPSSRPTESWPVANLDFDADNFRLPPEMQGAPQNDLFVYFIKNYDPEELAWSMAENGYWEEEPLLTIDTAKGTGHRTVIEGNRRLAALKLLTEPEARQLTGRVEFWNELADLAADQDLASVPTRNYLDRSGLIEYLGFRHVSGLMSWSADAKARFIYSLIEEYGYDFGRAAKVIGSRRDTIRRNFVAWAAIEQARKAGIDTEPAALHFGVYYRALQNPRARDFLNLEGWIDGSEKNHAPLLADGSERLGEFLGYVFGTTRVIKESRELDKLALALDDESSLSILRTERDLDLALRSRPVDRAGVLGELRLAYRHAATANAEAFHFAGDEDLTNDARRLEEIAGRIIASLTPER